MVRNMAVRVRALGLAAATVIVLGGTSAWAQGEVRVPAPVSGRSVGGSDPLQPADLLARINLLKTHLEQLRAFMGRPRPPAPLIRVEGAEIRELFAQAAIFHQRVQQFGFELLRAPLEDTPQRDQDESPPDSTDVMRVLDAALFRVLQVKRHLGIDRPVAEEIRPSSTTPTEVFNATLEAGQLAHTLLDKKTNASLVYSITLYNLQVARQLHALKTRKFLPKPTPFEPGKTPGDTYGILLECFDAVRVITNRLGLRGLTFEVRTKDRPVVPDDVLELAGIVLSELFTLRQTFQPGARNLPFVLFSRKFPAHSYQRARDLKAVLSNLSDLRPPARKR